MAAPIALSLILLQAATWGLVLRRTQVVTQGSRHWLKYASQVGASSSRPEGSASPCVKGSRDSRGVSAARTAPNAKAHNPTVESGS